MGEWVTIKPLKSIWISGLLLLSFAFLAGCGRYGPPLPPEAYAPAAVQELEVQTSTSGVQFTWKSPDEDRRGKSLEDLSYYDIRRANTDDLVEFLKDPLLQSELIGRSYDYSQQLLEAKREEAREEKIPARKAKIEDVLRTHKFEDATAKAGNIYIYSIVPVDSEGISGEVSQYVKVNFSGLTSKVRILDSASFDKPYTLDF